MKKIVLSLLFLVALPTAALSLDNQTQEILEKRTCQYLKSGWTLGETARAIRYAVEQNSSSRSEYELVNILRDRLNDQNLCQLYELGNCQELINILRKRLNDELTKEILVNSKKRCPEFFPRN